MFQTLQLQISSNDQNTLIHSDWENEFRIKKNKNEIPTNNDASEAPGTNRKIIRSNHPNDYEDDWNENEKIRSKIM